MSKIVQDAPKRAEWIAQILRDSGYKADFSLKSLREIDRFLDDHGKSGQPVPGGLLAEQFGPRMFGLGSYVGEVIRRTRGGYWHADDSDPRAEVNIQLVFTDGSSCWPVQRVMKRFRNGKVDSIAAFIQELSVTGGQHEHARRGKKKPWWKFW